MAIPGILQQLAKTNPMMQRVKQMMNMGNPSAMLNQLMQNNPQVKQVMDMINTQYGGDAEKAFRTVAEKNGINPEDILNMMK